MLRKLLIGVMIAIVALVGVGLVMPMQWHTERTVAIAAPAAVVFPLISDLQRWPDWTRWNEANDPTLQLRFDGPTAGAGAVMTWTGEQVGEGRLTIVESVPGRRIGYELQLEQGGLVSRGEIVVEPTTRGGVAVAWRTDGELGWSPLVRLMGPWIEQAVGSDFERGLAGLRRVAEGRTI